MEQFIASLGFQFKKVQYWRTQSIWKSILYVVMLIITTNMVVFGVKWVNHSTLDSTLPEFQITSEKLVYDESFSFELSLLNLAVMVGDEVETNEAQTLLLSEEGWMFKRSGLATTFNNYEDLLNLLGRSELSDSDVENVLNSLNWFYPIYAYGTIVFDLLIHAILISLLAFAGFGFRKFVTLRYPEVWTMTAYGITAPIVVRTIIDLLPLTVQVLPVLYWATVGFFAFMTIQKIGDE